MVKMRFIVYIIIFVVGIGFVTDDKEEMPYKEYSLHAGDKIPGEVNGYSVEEIRENTIIVMSPTGMHEISDGSFHIFDIGIYVVDISENLVTLQIYNVTAVNT